MAKKFKDTKVGKFINEKGVLQKVLDGVGDLGIPGVSLVANVVNEFLPNLSPEEKQEFHASLQEYESEYKDILYDIQNARNREIEIAKTGKKDFMMLAAGIIGLGSFVFLIVTLVFVRIPVENKEVLNLIIGQVMGVASTIFVYYYGSSRSSANHANTIKEMIDKK